jgi:N-methylhydantoinase A
VSYRVGVDIGGTFTDIVCLGADGAVHTRKVASTVDDYARGIVEGLRALLAERGLTPAAAAEVLHGTTVASNAILEGRGARTGLVTTRGFRDVLEIRRLRMPRLYDLRWEKPAPLVERRLRREVDERITAGGEVARPLDPAEAERVLRGLLADGVEALAICLLNSYANPAHEEQLAALARRLAPALPLSVSAQVLPEIKEYERTATTVVNAYVMPVVSRYLAALQAGLAGAGLGAPLLLMQSSGGLMPAAAAAAAPVHVIESGPAAGVVGARALARRLGLERIITLDMGGTTAKAAIVEDGEVARAAEHQVGGGISIGSRLLTGAGYLLRVPAIDLAEVGAGGGSIVWIDAGGALQVGPRSAGAVPGPLCYDAGGEVPTVTDANVILGYLNPAELAGGAVKLNAARAREGFAELVARPLGLPLEHAAHAAHVIAAASMMRAVRAVSSERGRDPREYALFAFGGNGPLFAAHMAAALEMRRIVVPPAPGLFSAFGLLYADVEHHYVRSFRGPLGAVDLDRLARAWARMEAEALAQLRADGFPGAAARLDRAVDCRYQGQSFELTVPAPPGPLDAPALAALGEAFGREHERTYGHRAGPQEPVELVALRLVARGLPDRPRLHETLGVDRAGRSAGDRRPVYFGPEPGWLDTPVLDRPALAGGRRGPCVVEEYDATCLVPPGAVAALDGAGNIVIDLEGGA